MPIEFTNEKTITDRDGDMIRTSIEMDADQPTGDIVVRIADESSDYFSVILTPEQVRDLIADLEDLV